MDLASIKQAILQRIPLDKVYHVGMGAAAALVTVLLVFIARVSIPFAAFAGGALLGAAYEVVQRIRHDGEPSISDAIATAAGAATIAGLLAAFAF